MDLSKCESGNVTFAKTSPTVTAVISVSLNLKVKKDAGDLAAVWAELRAQVLADPALAGSPLQEGTEDMTLEIQKRTIRGSLRFGAPATPQK